MSAGTQLLSIERVPLTELAGMLGHTRPFAEVPADALGSLSVVDRVKAPAGATLMEPGQAVLYYWLVLDGECRADRVEPDGSLRERQRTGSHGVWPCHLAVDQAGARLVVSNYLDGTVAAWPLTVDGTLAEPGHVWHLTGSGPVVAARGGCRR